MDEAVLFTAVFESSSLEMRRVWCVNKTDLINNSTNTGERSLKSVLQTLLRAVHGVLNKQLEEYMKEAKETKAKPEAKANVPAAPVTAAPAGSAANATAVQAPVEAKKEEAKKM